MTLEKAGENSGANQTSIIEGTVKFRDGKKWKSRWCVMRKLSPVADCVHLQLYRDEKDRIKNGQTKASLSLQQFLGLEFGFTLDKESNTLAVLCRDVSPVLAFCNVETLLQWKTRAARALGGADSATEGKVYPAMLALSPSAARAPKGPVRVHITTRTARLCLTMGLPPRVLAAWDIADLRRYGLVDGRLCFEVGARGGRTEGAWALLVDRADKLLDTIYNAASSMHSVHDLRKQIKFKREKRLSESNECNDLDISLDQMSETDSSIGFGDSASLLDVQMNKNNESYNSGRSVSVGRCSSCISRFGAQAGTSWAQDSFNEMRPDVDRTSLYSHSSGGTSEYSVPKNVWRDNAITNSRRSSPICSVTVPSPCGLCTCNILLLPKKVFSGAYENYDVPKTLPLIKESSITDNYDVPKKLRKCLLDDSSNCICYKTLSMQEDGIKSVEDAKVPFEETFQKDALNVLSNYINIDPNTKTDNLDLDLDKASDLTWKDFEDSDNILRNAGFSQNEIDALENIPENESDSETADNNTLKKKDSSQHYLCMEPHDVVKNIRCNTLDRKALPKNNTGSLTFNSRRKSSSADFLKKAEEFFDLPKSNSHKNVSEEVKPISIKPINSFKLNELNPNLSFNKVETVKLTKVDNMLIAKFKDSVKIRRSSSVPTKSDKNRDSSSSSDSGISTGSLKHHRFDINELGLHTSKSADLRRVYPKLLIHPPAFADPMQQLSFKFHESDKSTMGSAETASILRKRKGLTIYDGRANRSPSSCGSDTSDYYETLSISSFGSNEANNRSTTRPRSGREYSNIQSTLRLQSACEQCCHQEV